MFDDADGLTASVIASCRRSRDERLRYLIERLVHHLHALVVETRLTEEEFERVVEFVTGIGQATTPFHNEVILAADVLGVASLVKLVNHDAAKGSTAPALLGPFYRANAPVCETGSSIARCGVDGVPLIVTGRVTDESGRPLAEAEVDVWQASPIGLYDNQDATQPDMNFRGRFLTDQDGRFCFRTVRPAGYPVPTDGPVGGLLRALGRTARRPAHIHYLVWKAGYQALVTQVFVDEDEALASDTVFGVRNCLVGELVRRDEPDPRFPDIVPPYYTLNYDFTLSPGETVLPKAPIQ